MQNLTLTPRYRLPGGFMIDGATLLRAMLLLALFAVLLWGNDAFAQAKLPTGDKLSIPGTAEGDSWAKKIVYAIVFIIVLMALAGLGKGLVDFIFNMFNDANDARQTDGGWGATLKKVGIGLVLIIVAVVVYMVLNEYVIDPLLKMFG